MGVNTFLSSLLICLSIALVGCTPPGATGSTTLIMAGTLLGEEEADTSRVALIFAPPDRAATEVASVSSSASTLDYGSIAQAEGAALARLRLQAALAQADAVVGIERQVVDTGAWITYDEDIFFDRHDRGFRDRRGPGFETFSGSARERRDIEVNFRGTAVRYVE